MDESILISVKEFLNIQRDYHSFDSEIMMHINSSIFKLFDFGVVKDQKFRVTGENEKWSDLLSDEDNLEAAKEYIFINTKLIFDPPQSSFVVETLKEIAKEDAWRLTARNDLKDVLK